MGKDLKGKELGSGIYQRKNGRYCARFLNRFGKRDCIYGDSVREVKSKLDAAIKDDIANKNVVNVNTTLDMWYEKWMKVYKVPVVRENTRIYYESLYEKKISPVLGKRKLTEITKIDITELINKLSENYEWETLNKVKILLVDMFNRALEDDFVIKNPAKGVRLPKNKPEYSVNALSEDDQISFFDCCSGTFYNNLFVVALHTGLRPGELFALEEKDINFEKKEISVTKTLVYQKYKDDEQKEFHIEDPKTLESIRKVPMNKTCELALRRQISQAKVIKDRIVNLNDKRKERSENTDFLFTTQFGTPLNTQIYCDAIKKIVNEINMTRDPIDQMEYFAGHVFRHTFATRCFEAGVQPKVIQKYLGHKNIQITLNVYTSVFDNVKQQGIDMLERKILKISRNSDLAEEMRMCG